MWRSRIVPLYSHGQLCIITCYQNVQTGPRSLVSIQRQRETSRPPEETFLVPTPNRPNDNSSYIKKLRFIYLQATCKLAIIHKWPSRKGVAYQIPITPLHAKPFKWSTLKFFWQAVDIIAWLQEIINIKLSLRNLGSWANLFQWRELAGARGNGKLSQEIHLNGPANCFQKQLLLQRWKSNQLPEELSRLPSVFLLQLLHQEDGSMDNTVTFKPEI